MNSSRSRRAASGSLSNTRWNRLRAMRNTSARSSATAAPGRGVPTTSASSPISAPDPAIVSWRPEVMRNDPLRTT